MSLAPESVSRVSNLVLGPVFGAERSTVWRDLFVERSEDSRVIGPRVVSREQSKGKGSREVRVEGG